MSLVTGQIMFEEPPVFDKALLTVKLEDVSLAGMPATVIASDTCHIAGSDVIKITFELTLDADIAELNPRSTYSVSAHVSLHPDDDPTDIRQGDYLTMQSYPVLTQGNPSTIEVEVKRIG